MTPKPKIDPAAFRHRNPPIPGIQKTDTQIPGLISAIGITPPAGMIAAIEADRRADTGALSDDRTPEKHTEGTA